VLLVRWPMVISESKKLVGASIHGALVSRWAHDHAGARTHLTEPIGATSKSCRRNCTARLTPMR
jgi:hypothetical protein